MLDKDAFKTKYKTTYAQCNEESILDKLSEEDKELWADVEILTGRNCGTGGFNKYNNFGEKNRGKTYDTTDQRLRNAWKRYIDSKDESEINEIFEKIWINAKRGNFNYSKFLMEKLYGKEVENINMKVKSEVKIKYSFDLGEKNIGDKE